LEAQSLERNQLWHLWQLGFKMFQDVSRCFKMFQDVSSGLAIIGFKLASAWSGFHLA
jgi:hypothetical protein